MAEPNNFVNPCTSSLKPYPMEALTRIKNDLNVRGIKIYDFGTGDPKIPCWPEPNEILKKNIPAISQYPTARGSAALIEAQKSYLQRRFSIADFSNIELAATRGSKEAIFHVALSIVGRANNKRHIIFPDPGYPVYYSSTLFAGGVPVPMELGPQNNFLMQPWELPNEVQESAAAIWVNYPHNPTGKMVDRNYWEKIIAWTHAKNCLLLSDDCYIDIYHADWDQSAEGLKKRPLCPLEISTDRIICFFSLSKRSGLTGYRSGFMAGDARFMRAHLEARANMGVGTPSFLEAASAAAWRDDDHVADRRKIFTQRIAAAAPTLKKLGLLETVPESTFYLWCKIPSSYGTDDIRFCLELAERGVITSPSQWLSLGVKGFFRIALVPDEQETAKAMQILQDFISSETK